MATAASQVKAPPKQVQAQVAAAEEIIKQVATDDLKVSKDTEIDDLLASVGEPSAERTDEEAPSVVAEEPPAKPREDWKQKYYVLKGKYDAEVPRLHDDVKELKAQVTKIIDTPAPVPEVTTPENIAPGFKYMKPDEIEDYGEEFMDMVGRRAQEVAEQQFVPVITELRDELTGFKGQLANTGQRVQATETQSFYAQLDSTVEDWRKINEDPQFLEWLDTDIPETDGIKRKEMLMKAFNTGDVGHVGAFFNNFKSVSGQENAPSPGSEVPSEAEQSSTLTLDNFVAPTSGQGSPQGAPANGSTQQKIWTQAEIAQFYRNSKDGKYRTRPEDKAKVEAAIIKAVGEGRVR